MADVLDDLCRIKAGQAPRGPHGAAPAGRRRRLVVGAVAALTALSGLVVVVRMYETHPPRPR